MRNRHVGRTITPAAGPVEKGRNRYLLFSIALPLAVIVPAASYIVLMPQHDDIAIAIRQAGFDPLVPPSRLRGPGALYEVDGNRYRKVCDVEPETLTGKLQKSPTLERVRQSLEKGGFSLSGDYLKSLNAKLGADRMVSVEYSLTNVAISEISMSDLAEIQDALLSEKSCDRVVQSLLKANKQVCAGYAAISATTSYKVRVNSKFESGADNVPVVDQVKRALETHAGSEIRVESADQLSGDDLFYGIQLSQLCITPDTATEPSVLAPQPAPARPGLLARLWGN
jgi:hypothetical protein